MNYKHPVRTFPTSSSLHSKEARAYMRQVKDLYKGLEEPMFRTTYSEGVCTVEVLPPPSQDAPIRRLFNEAK